MCDILPKKSTSLLQRGIQNNPCTQKRCNIQVTTTRSGIKYTFGL